MRTTETLWRSAESSYIRVLPEAIRVSPRRCSQPLQRAVCAFGLKESFEKAAESVVEHYGFELPLSTVATVTRENAGKIARRQAEGELTGLGGLFGQAQALVEHAEKEIENRAQRQGHRGVEKTPRTGQLGG